MNLLTNAFTSDISALQREQEHLRVTVKAARDVADERDRTIHYAEGEKQGLTRILHDQEGAIKHLQKELDEVWWHTNDYVNSYIDATIS